MLLHRRTIRMRRELSISLLKQVHYISSVALRNLLFFCVVKGFLKLSLLDISYCGVSEWSQVQEFGKLPSLRELVLDGNPLGVVEPPFDETFQALCRLSMSSTK